MRRRGLTEADRQIWANYARFVTPRVAGPGAPPGATAGPVAPPSPPPPEAPRAPAVPPVRGRMLAPLEIGSSPGGVDRGTWVRFRGGKLSPQRTLDLHGRTVQRAHADLHAFLGQAMAERLRCVEIITGRGSGERGGVLRREVPLWINDASLRPVVLAAAHPHAANQGSIRLLLRRTR